MLVTYLSLAVPIFNILYNVRCFDNIAGFRLFYTCWAKTKLTALYTNQVLEYFTVTLYFGLELGNTALSWKYIFPIEVKPKFVNQAKNIPMVLQSSQSKFGKIGERVPEFWSDIPTNKQTDKQRLLLYVNR